MLCSPAKAYRPEHRPSSLPCRSSERELGLAAFLKCLGPQASSLLHFSLFSVSTHMHTPRSTGEGLLQKDTHHGTHWRLFICRFYGKQLLLLHSPLSAFTAVLKSYLNGNWKDQCYNSTQELRNLPHGSFVPSVGYTELFEKVKLKTKNLIFQPQ